MTIKIQARKIICFGGLCLKKAFLMADGCFVLLLAAWVLFQIKYFGKIYPNIQMAGIYLSGLKPAEAEGQIKEKAEAENKAVITFSSPEGTVSAAAADLKINFLAENNALRAFSLGRKGDFFSNLADEIRLLNKGEVLAVEIGFDDAALRQSLNPLLVRIYEEPVPPLLTIKGEGGSRRVEIDPGRSGKDINWTKLKQDLAKQLAGFKSKPLVEVSQMEINLSVKQSDLQNTRQRAEKLLGKSITLKTADKSWQIDDNKLVAFLAYDDGYQENKIASYTALLSKSTDRNPENALFVYEAGQVKEFKPAVDGQKLDEKESRVLLSAAVKELENSTELIKEINLPLKTSPAKISTADSNSFGISGRLGKGESWYFHSIPSRIHNLDLASSKFHGLLVAPGEELSFNQTVGDISMQTGYQQAYIIKEGRTILGDGGGVCQVSTTLFRAAMQAGLEIVSRTGHAYRVSYYEYNSQLGQDATVYSPSPDLVIRNNTDHYILIQKEIDPANYYLAFSIYGAPDGRQVSISPTRIWDQSPPPPDLYQDDPTLPAGTVKQVDWAAWGAKTAFDYKVVKDGAVLQEKTFYTTYKPWQAIYLQGTKSS